MRLGVYDLGGNGPRTDRLGTILGRRGALFRVIFGSFLGSLFWLLFGPLLGSKMDPKTDPKPLQNSTFLRSIFGLLFWKVLELSRDLLGAFLGLLRLSWEASGSQKPKTNLWFFEVFENVTFWACIRPYEDILKTSSK